MIAQSLIRRKPKSDVASLFVGVLNRDEKGRPTTCLVPGSEAKHYHIILRRFMSKEVVREEIIWLPTISAECRLQVAIGHIGCPGNGTRYIRKKRRQDLDTICYHSRAAIDRSIKDVGYQASWCQSYEDAERLCNMMGGQIYKVVSRQNTSVAYLAVKER